MNRAPKKNQIINTNRKGGEASMKFTSPKSFLGCTTHVNADQPSLRQMIQLVAA